MLAVIHAVTASSSLLDVAGRPLIGRQIQWLRAIGCDRIVVHVGLGTAADAVAAWIEQEEVVGPDIVIVLARAELDPRSIALRAGMTGAVPMLVVPSDVLGDGDLSSLFVHADTAETIARGDAPANLDLVRGEVRLLGLGANSVSVSAPGWLVRLRSERDALTLGLAAIGGTLPSSRGEGLGITIHARLRAPGVYVARGAQVADGATLVAPVLIGARVIVDDGATVGPGVIVGAGAVISEGSVIRSARVAPDVIIGEHLVVEDCVARADGLYPLEGEAISIDDRLMLGEARSTDRSIASRVTALLLLFALPLILVLRALGVRGPSLSGLVDVVAGRRSLVGVDRLMEPEGSLELLDRARLAPEGAFDVEPALVGRDADVDSRLRARAWYAAEKSFAVDVRLVLGSLRG